MKALGQSYIVPRDRYILWNILCGERFAFCMYHSFACANESSNAQKIDENLVKFHARRICLWRSTSRAVSFERRMKEDTDSQRR